MAERPSGPAGAPSTVSGPSAAAKQQAEKKGKKADTGTQQSVNAGSSPEIESKVPSRFRNAISTVTKKVGKKPDASSVIR